MSVERIAALADSYRNSANFLAVVGDVEPMLAYQQVVSLLDQAVAAVKVAAELSAGGVIKGRVLTDPDDVAAFYQPVSRSVAVWTDSRLVEFSEGEAEAIHAALGDALAVRGVARAFATMGEGAAA